MDVVNRLLEHKDLDTKSNCLPPCTKMVFKLQQVAQKKWKDSSITNSIQIFVQENVSEFTKVYSYSPSDYLVEIGSSLGLWLGLSVISLFDILISLYRFVTKSVEQSLGHNKDK